MLMLAFAWSIVLNLIVFVLCAYKIVNPVGERSNLVNMIFRDGLIYLFIAYVVVFNRRIKI